MKHLQRTITCLIATIICGVILPANAGTYESGRIGGAGGKKTKLVDCGTNAVAIGLHGRRGSWVDSIGLICRKVNTNGTLGTTFTRTPAGGSGGFADEARCTGSNQALSSMVIYYGSFVHGAPIRCKDWDSSNRRTKGKLKSSQNPWFGTTAVSKFKVACPDEKPVQALRVRYGSFVDSIRVICRDVPRPVLLRKMK